MSVAAVGAKPVVAQPEAKAKAKAGATEPTGNALPGVIAGGVAIAGLTTLGTTWGAMPLPVALTLGAAVGGPIIGISLMNSDGKPNKAWQSALVGAAPFAAVGGLLGGIGANMTGQATLGKFTGGALVGAVMIGAVGAGLGALTHAFTKPRD